MFKGLIKYIILKIHLLSLFDSFDIGVIVYQMVDLSHLLFALQMVNQVRRRWTISETYTNTETFYVLKFLSISLYPGIPPSLHHYYNLYSVHHPQAMAMMHAQLLLPVGGLLVIGIPVKINIYSNLVFHSHAASCLIMGIADRRFAWSGSW